MTDAEISRRLALAIGWELADELMGHIYVWENDAPAKRFDYRDPAVIWPIAVRFNALPEKAWGARRWVVERWEPVYQYTETDTAAKAVALAVIKAKEQK